MDITKDAIAAYDKAYPAQVVLDRKAMAGYLDQYGAGDERRIKIIKTLVISLVTLVVLGGVAVFRFPQLSAGASGEPLPGAAAGEGLPGRPTNFGWHGEKDRPGYPFQSFLQDWGPGSAHADVSGSKISKSRSCGNGVILTVDFAKGKQEKLWVQREDLVIGFSPLPGCPAPR